MRVKVLKIKNLSGKKPSLISLQSQKGGLLEYLVKYFDELAVKID